MLLILAILLLLATPLTVIGLRRVRARVGAQWLMAALGALLALASVWLLRPRLPLTLTLLDWSANSPFLESPALLADLFSWPFALAIATLALAVILTGVGRLEDLESGAWTGSLAVSALGILAVLAGNPLTLVLAWTALDILELVMLLTRVDDPSRRRSVVVYFSTNLLGTFLVLFADAQARALGEPLTFASIPAAVSPYHFLAAGLRLGVLPLHLPFVREPDLRRGFGTVLRLVSPAASLTLLARAAAGGIPLAVEWPVILLLALAALYAAIAWLRVPDELVGRPFWILGFSALAFASALYGAENAVLSWSLAGLFSGSTLFLSARPGRSRLIIGIFSAIVFLGLPYTPMHAGLRLYLRFNGLHIPFLVAHALLAVGYIRFLLRPPDPPEARPERWIRAVYPAGLLLLFASHWAATFPQLTLPAPLWATLVILVLVLVLGGLGRRRISVPAPLFTVLDRVFSFRWLATVLEWALQLISRAAAIANRLLEGEGGILWALVLLVFLITLLRQFGGGG
ncbi:MAG: hypothetical protein EPO32_02955 [Anaerolineae bacterium]|nr:MAG: hypothetical protein EPO32_02955 [Anaerolineae bacterium]